jgi:hypothetical protein
MRFRKSSAMISESEMVEFEKRYKDAYRVLVFAGRTIEEMDLYSREIYLNSVINVHTERFERLLKGRVDNQGIMSQKEIKLSDELLLQCRSYIDLHLRVYHVRTGTDHVPMSFEGKI